MKIDSKQILEIAGVVAVIVSLLFVASEISQSNRIAIREARSELISQELELQNSFLENPELSALMLKLKDKDPNLSPLDEFQAESFAMQLILRTADLNISYESDFMTEETLRRQVLGITRNIDRVPGIVPYLRSTAEDLGIVRNVSPVWGAFFDEMEKFE